MVWKGKWQRSVCASPVKAPQIVSPPFLLTFNLEIWCKLSATPHFHLKNCMATPPPPLGVKFFAILQHPVALRQQCHCFAHMGTRLLSFYCLDFCHCLLHVPRFHCIAIRIHSVKVTVPPLYRAKRMQVFMRGRESRL